MSRLLDLDHRLALVAHRLARALGFRGTFLALIATLDLVWAYSWIDPAAARVVKFSPTYRVILGLAPLRFWAVLLAGVGLLCGIQCWLDDDRAAFAAAIGIKLMLAALTLAAWPTAGPATMRQATIFLILGGIVSVCAAGLPFREE